MKTCSKCGKNKSIKEFRKKTRSKDGHGPECKKCSATVWKRWHLKNVMKHRQNAKTWLSNNHDKRLVQASKWRKNNKEKISQINSRWSENRDPKVAKAAWRRTWLKSTYGITSEQYDEMLKKQKGLCRICGGVNKSGRRLHIDHDHSTGAIRDLLCFGCNGGLGGFKDNQELLFKAIQYLNRHRIG